MSRFSTAAAAAVDLTGHFFAELPGPTVLNVGAGWTGHVVAGTMVVNVDHVRPAITGPGAFVLADGQQLPFASATFSGTLLKDVLEHVLDPIGLLAELRRVAQPDARLLVTTPRAIPRAVWDDPTHVRGFTDRALTEALAHAGWEPTGAPRRIGSLPGAGRLGLAHRVEDILAVPLIGHWFGTNWIVRARAVG